ncbi:MAG: FtsK/SpoIIIE domain-containing protein [Bacillota bacterium]
MKRVVAYLAQGLAAAAMGGIFCAAWLFNSDVQEFLSFLPRDLMLAGAKLGLGIPIFCAALWFLRSRRGKLLPALSALFSRRRGGVPKRAVAADPALALLPAPPEPLGERSGQGYARQVAPALEHCGLTQPGQRVVVRAVTDGPTAARIVINLPPGMRLSRLANATRDLQAALGAPSLQVEAGPQANTAALIITHRKKQPVVLRQILDTPDFAAQARRPDLPVPVGVDPVGQPLITDMTQVAHLLVAGATKSGKSWWLNQLMVTWLLYRGPDQLRLVLVDPKRVELTQYADFPHVLTVARTADAAVEALQRLVAEMERRYALFERAGVRNIAGHRQKSGANLPYIACVIDELADLMVASGKEISGTVTTCLQRLTQLARAAGIHLVVATQRPSVDVIPGVIKANLPSRVVFRLVTQADYSTVLDQDPGVSLTGKGDGLALLEGEAGLIRFQSAGVGQDDNETDRTLDKIRDYWQKQAVRPAEVPAFSEVAPSTPANPDQTDQEAARATAALDPLDRAKAYFAELLVESEQEPVYAPSADALSREWKTRKADVIDLLGRLEKEGWLSPVQKAGRGAKRQVVIRRTVALEWLDQEK